MVGRYIRDGLKYRKENAYLEMEKHPNEEEILQFTCAAFHGVKVGAVVSPLSCADPPDDPVQTDGGPIQVIRAGPTNVRARMLW